MILRRYGQRVESVEIAFSSVALTNIAWRRDHAFSVSFDDFEATYERVREHPLTARAEGPVQIEVETALLADLEAQVRALDESLEDDQVLLVENQRGVDEPRPREKRKDVIVEGENRLYFIWWVDPPLRLAVYRKRS